MRVITCYEAGIKVRVMQGLANNVEVLICIYVQDIKYLKTRSGFGLAYDPLSLQLVPRLRSLGIHVANLIITHYKSESSVQKLLRVAKNEFNLKVTLHKEVQGYPWDVAFVLSDEDMGKIRI